MSHSHNQLPVNPNSNRNRVPEGAELASLRATASHLQSVIDHNTQAAEDARERYEDIKARYDVHALILEGIGSELHAAKLSVDVLGEQAASLEPKLQELRGLLHPIRRCSDAILRLIFEEHVDDRVDFNHEGFIVATLLSHVCRRWRIVALSTPSIWTDVCFEPRPSAGVSISKASAFLDRVKAVPTTVYININGDTPIFTASIPFTTIYRVPVISDLVFRIYGDPEGALDAVTVFPNRHIDRLELAASTTGPIDIGLFLSKFRTFRNLEMTCMEFGPFLSPNLSYSLSKLENIDFIGVTEVPIIDLLALAPRLRILKMRRCNVRDNLEGGIDQCISADLQYLCIHSEGVPWRKIRSPALVEFVTGPLPGITHREGFWDFLSQCHAMTSMKFDDTDPEKFALLVDLVPNLRDLTMLCKNAASIISVLMALTGLQLPSPLLPRLECLKLTCNGRHLEAATLETFVRRRCLCREDPESTMDTGIPWALRLFSIEIRCWGVEWRHTPLLEKYSVETGSSVVVYRVVGQA